MSEIKKLKSLLENARIVSVNESKNPESLCNFHVESDDGRRRSFTLYATDLGCWVDDIVCDGRYNNMVDMLASIHNHTYACQKLIKHVEEPDLMGYFVCDCGELFLVLEKNIGAEFRKILEGNEAMKKLAHLLSDGVFVYNPKNLLLELQFLDEV